MQPRPKERDCIVHWQWLDAFPPRLDSLHLPWKWGEAWDGSHTTAPSPKIRQVLQAGRTTRWVASNPSLPVIAPATRLCFTLWWAKARKVPFGRAKSTFCKSLKFVEFRYGGRPQGFENSTLKCTFRQRVPWGYLRRQHLLVFAQGFHFSLEQCKPLFLPWDQAVLDICGCW